MKLFIYLFVYLFVFSINTKAQTNLNFETGNTTGWIVNGLTTIVTGGTDSCGAFNRVFNGGVGNNSTSLRLGLGFGTNGTASQTFLVTQNNACFTYNFAVITDNGPGHGCNTGVTNSGLNFFVSTSTGTVPCYTYDHFITCDGVNAAWQTSPCGRYSLWRAVSVDLSAYIGLMVTVNFSGGACSSGGGHGGYAYIDCGAQPMNLLVNGANTMPANSFLCSSTNYIISAPSGFLYTWNGPGITGVTTQTINPTIVGIYTLSLAYTNPNTNTCLTSTPTFTFGLIDTPTANFTVAPRCYGFTTNFVNTTGSSSANNSIGVINTYTWDLGDGSPDVNNVNPNYTYVGGNSNNAYAVTLTASANGCVNQISKPATIFANPSVAVTTGSLCVGTSITLNASGATTYSWSNAATGSSVSVSPNSDINYVVTGTDINGCKNSAVASVSVFPIPPVSVTSGTTCPNQGLSIFAGGATTYTWVASPTLFPHDSNNNEAVVFPTTPTTYTVYGADNNGCINSGTTTVYTSVPPDFSLTTATVCPNITATLVATAISPISSFFWSNGTNALETIASATATTIYTCTANTDNGCSSAKTTTLYVYPSPVLGSASGSVCSGKPFTLNASGAVSYTWSTGSNNASIVVSPTVTTSYLFSGASANGCVGNSIVTVTVVPLPNVFIAPKSVCLGKSVVLTALGGGNYTWSNNATTQTISVSPTANATYTCIGLALTGCSNTAVTTVTVFPTPTVALTTASICAGQTATITAAAANTYTWSTGNHSSSIYVLPIVTTSYSCVGLSVNNCEYTSTTVVNVTSVATPSISQNGAILTSSSATGNQWYLNGVTIPGATGQTHITSQNGNYSLIVTIGSCSSNSVNKTILDTGLEDFDLKNNLVVFPNPTSNNVSIKLISSDETVTVKIYNATGQYLKTTTITGQNVFIDLQNEAKGLYLFECSLKQHKAFFKVIKM